MNKDTHSLFESYRLVLEKKKGTKKVEKELEKDGYKKVSDKKSGHNKGGKTYAKKIGKGLERDVTIKDGGEKLHIHKSEDIQEAVSETSAFLHRLAARLQADQTNSYTNEDIYKIREIAKKF
jgi:hypothetical protein